VNIHIDLISCQIAILVNILDFGYGNFANGSDTLQNRLVRRQRSNVSHSL